MRDLVAKYGSFQSNEPSKAESNGFSSHGRIVILTGATGSLGAHILSSICNISSVTRIICLVRASSPEEAESRVNASLTKRRLPRLLPRAPLKRPSVECVPAELGIPMLGLPSALLHMIRYSATLVIHAAWAVNFSMRLRSFEDEHIRGLRHLLDLLLSSRAEPAKFVFCSSVASVLGRRGMDIATSKAAVILEAISTKPQEASELGYSRSKWIAEAICSEAHEKTRLKGMIDVVRIGQLCGDTENGVWNSTEAWPTMLSSVAATGCLPDLRDETLGWLAVDLTARAIVQIALGGNDITGVNETSECPVYHVLNPDQSVKWADMLDWIRELRSEPFQVVNATKWIARLEGLDGEHGNHPAKRLLSLWKNAYCQNQDEKETVNELQKESDGEGKQLEPIQFSMRLTKEAAPIMREVGPLTKEHFERIWRWIESDMIQGNGG